MSDYVLLVATDIPNHLKTLSESIAKGEQSEGGQETQDNRNRLPEADGAGNGCASKNDGSKQAQLDAIGLAVLLAVAAQEV